jgi:4a-hydroxytetrahydrobiopterin dehydratase
MDEIEVTLYTRRHCPLCEKTKSAIEAASRQHALRVVLDEVDVDSDLDLLRRFTDDVPVVYIDGKEAFRHRVDAEEFAAYVRQRGDRMESELAKEKCVPCRGGVPPLKGEALAPLIKQLGEEWRVVEEHHLEREFRFPDFAKALAFTNSIGAIAEAEGHHPDIYLAWGKVRVTIWTHKIDGLTRSDFVLAAKLDRVGR